MNVAIQKGLDELKRELDARGYNTFFIGESKVADAVIYKDRDRFPYYEVNNVPSAAVSSDNANMGFGTLLVNATNKNIDEIVSILHNRTYSPLF